MVRAANTHKQRSDSRVPVDVSQCVARNGGTAATSLAYRKFPGSRTMWSLTLRVRCSPERTRQAHYSCVPHTCFTGCPKKLLAECSNGMAIDCLLAAAVRIQQELFTYAKNAFSARCATLSSLRIISCLCGPPAADSSEVTVLWEVADMSRFISGGDKDSRSARP